MHPLHPLSCNLFIYGGGIACLWVVSAAFMTGSAECRVFPDLMGPMVVLSDTPKVVFVLVLTLLQKLILCQSELGKPYQFGIDLIIH